MFVSDEVTLQCRLFTVGMSATHDHGCYAEAFLWSGGIHN